MQTLISIIIALIIFSVLVLIHEFGHFIVAKKCGVVVNEFSVGMGPRLLSRVAKSGTRYSIKALPFGGSCAMLGEDEDNAEKGSFNSKPLWARMAIVVAGPFFNFILAFLLALIVIGYNGIDISYVSKVTEGSNAYEAGLREGDRITKYNGATVSVGREIYLEDYVSPLDGSDISVTFVRDGKKQTISYAPDSEERYIVGISYYETDSKATISSVPEGSAMDQAGVVAGDEVVEINGTKISTGKDLKEYIDAHPFGKEEINITVKRNNKEKKVVVVPQMTKLYSSGFVYNLARDKQSVGGVLKYSLVEVRYEINTVLKSFVREDWTVPHIVSFDPETGEKIENLGGQGLGPDSAWSRGQSWAIYGFAIAARETGDTKYLTASKNIANYFLSHLPNDKVPYWDFRTAEKDKFVRDSTAAACTASGLLELSTLLTDEIEKTFYYESAIAILKGLYDHYSDFSNAQDAILTKGTVSYPNNKHVNVPIIYGDYYFLEALGKLHGHKGLF